MRQLLEKIEAAAVAGVDWMQIREKDLSGRQLTKLVSEAVRLVPATCRILVNDRLDVAITAGAGGVHLGEQSVPVDQAKRLLSERNCPEDFLVGASTHSLASACAAEESGADYVIFGPVFATPSKTAYGPPLGVGQLGEVCRSLSIPVIAIGGITVANASECAAAGAAGIAAIRMFQDAADLKAVVKTLRTP
jgi:thiamine-phosphate diphosphorylase